MFHELFFFNIVNNYGLFGSRKLTDALNPFWPGRELISTGVSTSLNGEDLPFINFVNLRAATENFSAANKLGEGGFGPVYKVSQHFILP